MFVLVYPSRNPTAVRSISSATTALNYPYRLPIEQHLGIRIPRPLPLEIEGVVVPGHDGNDGRTTAVSRDLDEDCQFLQASPVPRPLGHQTVPRNPGTFGAKRSLIFEPSQGQWNSSPNYHHYYDILDDMLRDPAVKRERSSEEEETTSLTKMKQVKKRVKRIDQKQDNSGIVRRSREIQHLLKGRNPNYQRPKRGDEATESLAASTPCVMKAKKTYRRPHANR